MAWPCHDNRNPQWFLGEQLSGNRQVDATNLEEACFALLTHIDRGCFEQCGQYGAAHEFALGGERVCEAQVGAGIVLAGIEFAGRFDAGQRVGNGFVETGRSKHVAHEVFVLEGQIGALHGELIGHDGGRQVVVAVHAGDFFAEIGGMTDILAVTGHVNEERMCVSGRAPELEACQQVGDLVAGKGQP